MTDNNNTLVVIPIGTVAYHAWMAHHAATGNHARAALMRALLGRGGKGWTERSEFPPGYGGAHE